jgi:hypothetical protein
MHPFLVDFRNDQNPMSNAVAHFEKHRNHFLDFGRVLVWRREMPGSHTEVYTELQNNK